MYTYASALGVPCGGIYSTLALVALRLLIKTLTTPKVSHMLLYSRHPALLPVTDAVHVSWPAQLPASIRTHITLKDLTSRAYVQPFQYPSVPKCSEPR